MQVQGGDIDVYIVDLDFAYSHAVRVVISLRRAVVCGVSSFLSFFFFFFLPCFFVCGVGDSYSEYEHCITSTGFTLGVLMVILRQWFYGESAISSFSIFCFLVFLVGISLWF